MSSPRPRSAAHRLLATTRREHDRQVAIAVWVYGLLLYLVWLMLFMLYVDTGWPDVGGALLPWVTTANVLWCVLLVLGLGNELLASRRVLSARIAPFLAAICVMVGLQLCVQARSRCQERLDRLASTLVDRIVYIECRDGRETPRVGRVTTSQAGHLVRYRGREFERKSTLWRRDRTTGRLYGFWGGAFSCISHSKRECGAATTSSSSQVSRS
jgi:hypothetical protein